VASSKIWHAAGTQASDPNLTSGLPSVDGISSHELHIAKVAFVAVADTD
jgi:hypothetical protein